MLEIASSQNKVAARNPQLDGLRAFAILLVIVAHASRFSNTILDNGREAVGVIGVSVFFVLSGFLITTLLIAERKRTGTIDLRAFFARRARRIFPAYYLYLSVLAIIAALGLIPIRAPEFLINAFYLRDYYVPSFRWLEHTWSLAVETQFYLFWPVLMLSLGNRRSKILALVCIAIAPIVRIVTYFLVPAQRDLATIALHTRVDMLMFGCAIALFMEAGVPKWLLALCSRCPPIVSLGILAICTIATAKFRGAFSLPIGMTLEGLAVSILLVNILLFEQTPFARLLKTPAATWIGQISYSLYLWQQPFLFPRNDWLLGRFPINLVAILLVSCASYYFVERTFFKPRPAKLAIEAA